MKLANFAIDSIRLSNQRSNVKKLMTALRSFSKETGTDVVRLRTGHGDSLQVLWNMAKEMLNLNEEAFDVNSTVIVPKVREGRTVFTETAFLSFAHIDRAALVAKIQEQGLTVKNPDGTDRQMILVEVGVARCDVDTLPEYEEYISKTPRTSYLGTV